MSRLRDELSDPWGPVLAGLFGGLSWAVGGPALLAVGVGAAVYGAKAVVGALVDREPTPGGGPELPAEGSPAREWLDRATSAVHELDKMMPGVTLTPTDVAAASTAEQARTVLEAMRRLGGQVVAVTTALGHADAPGLDQEADRLRQLAQDHPDDVSAGQSAQAVADRVAVRDRLRRAQGALDGRLQSSALGLEGLVARVAEVRAAASAVGQVDPSADDLAALTSEVEGLRLGLADVEQVAQRALG